VLTTTTLRSLVLAALIAGLSVVPQSASASITCGSPLPDLTQLPPGSPPKTSFEVVGSYPHDPKAFVEGLVWYDNGFYESTGLEGQSSLRRVDFPTGTVLQKVDLAPDLFGEGLAMVDTRLVQLTWQSHIGFVYDRDTLAQTATFVYPREGWGLTYDGTNLIASDGSDTLTLLDPNTIQELGTIHVTFAGCPIKNINELEWIDGEIWANIWLTDVVVRIDPSGNVTSYLDLAALRDPNLSSNRDAVLNGIAYDADNHRIFVTGKLWPKLFEIRPA
jgi:glutamine cyclotransferase